MVLEGYNYIRSQCDHISSIFAVLYMYHDVSHLCCCLYVSWCQPSLSFDGCRMVFAGSNQTLCQCDYMTVIFVVVPPWCSPSLLLLTGFTRLMTAIFVVVVLSWCPPSLLLFTGFTRLMTAIFVVVVLSWCPPSLLLFIGYTRLMAAIFVVVHRLYSFDGCRVVFEGSNYTHCQCDHMTSFVLLMMKGRIDVSVTWVPHIVRHCNRAETAQGLNIRPSGHGPLL